MKQLIKENRESYHYKFFEWSYPIMKKINDENKLGYDMEYIKNNVRISTSWSYRSKKNVMGTTMESQGSAKNYTEITISPNYNSDEDYFGTMVHEFVHAICFTLNHCGHDKKHFGKLARLFFLIGKLTQCGYSIEMWQLFKIDEFMKINGAYKDIHARIMTHYETNDEGNIIDEDGNEILDENGNPQKPKSSGKPKQTTRLLLAECKEHEYKIRLSKKCAMIGLPNCPICNEVLRLDEKSLKAMMSDTIKSEVKNETK
tara:strand:+ start:1280 stop:2053 length:774 start_codon:yes stop_codon:yes gene_type:complete